MYEYVEQMRWIMQLVDTQIEALEHLNRQLNDGTKEPSFYLMLDVDEAQMSISRSLRQVFESVDYKYINEIESLLKMQLIDAEALIEDCDNIGLIRIFRDVLIPTYSMWREELATRFNPIILN